MTPIEKLRTILSDTLATSRSETEELFIKSGMEALQEIEDTAIMLKKTITTIIG